MNVHNILLHLSLIPGVGPSTVKILLDQLGENIMHMYTMHEQDFVQLGTRVSIANALVKGLSSRKLFDAESALLEKHTIRWVSICDDEYPAILKEIHMPPIGLYVKGAKLHNNEKKLAAVGSRKAHGYARKAIENIVSDLIYNGWILVSGGAYGADTMVHKATLDHGGKTIAVLGSGLLRPYPLSNKKLFEHIVEHGGALISSFPLLSDPIPGNFPARNRIISGLSQGCLVIQAAEKSGASITAAFALEQGKEVFAIPGPIDDPLSAGCHELIRQGATLVQSADDILQVFGLKITKKHVAHVEQHQDNGILAYCMDPIALDDLAQKLDLGLDEAQEKLFNLQLEGLVQQDFTGLWYRT